MIIERKINELGYKLPNKIQTGIIEGAQRAGNLVISSGHGPFKDGKPIYVGRVGREVHLKQAKQAAKHLISGPLNLTMDFIPKDLSA